MPTPDVNPYVGLVLADLDSQDIYESAIAELAVILPNWIPREGNIEVLLLEALSQAAAEMVYAINRAPNAVVQAFLRMNGINYDIGAQAVTTLRFHVAGTYEVTIPAGTTVALAMDNELQPITFTTDSEAIVPEATTTVDIPATAVQYTADPNGYPAGTIVELIDSISMVDYVELADVVAGGVDYESDDSYFERGSQMFYRMTDTLVLPSQFVNAMLEMSFIERATALDMYTPDVVPTPAAPTVTQTGTGGTLGAGTYSYRVAALNAAGTTLASTAGTVVVASGTTNKTTVTWVAPVVPAGVGAITSYKVYGRTGGSELLMATVTAPTVTWQDTGSVTPSGALPAANTTGPTVGAVPGHITLVPYGDNAVLSGGQKTELTNKVTPLAMAALGVHISDPTITTVAVTVSVVRDTSYLAADVQANVTAALNAFLNPMTWNWDTKARRNALIRVIGNAPGVAYVDTMSVPAADVTLAGVAPLAKAGTITVTVT
jgi:uncharacterized phage protein gp47/JayE